MTGRPSVLLTNDDGIDAVGLAALVDALEGSADVTVVAPDRDRSGAGRTDTRRFTVERSEAGHAVDGTPCDCVHFGLAGLDDAFDVVVSGCNPGPNVGAHKLDRSGTVGAAKEAAFLGTPGIALSLYDPPEGHRPFEREEFAVAERVARYFVEATVCGRLDEHFDYLNINVPVSPADPELLRVTEPVHDFDVRIDDDGDAYTAYDHFYDPLRPDVPVEVDDLVGTDRRALADREISVSPLRVTGDSRVPEAFSSRLAGYPDALPEP